MLVLTRKKDSVVRIGEDIAVTVRDFSAEPEAVVVQVDHPAGLAVSMGGQEVAAEPVAGVPTDYADSTDVDLKGESEESAESAGNSGRRAVVTLKLEDSFTIGQHILVKVVALIRRGGVPYRVRLGFQAPKELRITREDQQPGGGC